MAGDALRPGLRRGLLHQVRARGAVGRQGLNDSLGLAATRYVLAVECARPGQTVTLSVLRVRTTVVARAGTDAIARIQRILSAALTLRITGITAAAVNEIRTD